MEVFHAFTLVSPEETQINVHRYTVNIIDEKCLLKEFWVTGFEAAIAKLAWTIMLSKWRKKYEKDNSITFPGV